MKYIDLSHRLYNGMVTFPGNPAVEIDCYMGREETSKTYGAKAQSLLDRIRMVNISGTYLDAPLHRFDDGYSVADIPLEKCTNLVYEVVRKRDDRNYIDADDVKDIGKPGGAVLLCTGFDQYFNTEKYGINPPYLTVNAARLLMERGVVFVGIDAPLIDDMNQLDTLGCPVHDIILGQGAVVCEDMTGIAKTEPYTRTGRLYAAPVKAEMASFTTRVFVQTEEKSV